MKYQNIICVLKQRRNVVLFISVCVGIAAICTLYYYKDPEISVFMPRCPFRAITGLSCPACGNQRALHSILNGELGKAIHYNYFLFISIPYLICLLISEIYNGGWFLYLRRITHDRKVVFFYLIFVCLWWLIRNILKI